MFLPPSPSLFLAVLLTCPGKLPIEYLVGIPRDLRLVFGAFARPR